MPDVIQGVKDLFLMFKIFRGACLLLTLLNIAESREALIYNHYCLKLTPNFSS